MQPSCRADDGYWDATGRSSVTELGVRGSMCLDTSKLARWGIRVSKYTVTMHVHIRKRISTSKRMIGMSGLVIWGALEQPHSKEKRIRAKGIVLIIIHVHRGMDMTGLLFTEGQK